MGLLPSIRLRPTFSPKLVRVLEFFDLRLLSSASPRAMSVGPRPTRNPAPPANTPLLPHAVGAVGSWSPGQSDPYLFDPPPALR